MNDNRYVLGVRTNGTKEAHNYLLDALEMLNDTKVLVEYGEVDIIVWDETTQQKQNVYGVVLDSPSEEQIQAFENIFKAYTKNDHIVEWDVCEEIVWDEKTRTKNKKVSDN